jgi:hypothetical protein
VLLDLDLALLRAFFGMPRLQICYYQPEIFHYQPEILCYQAPFSRTREKAEIFHYQAA